MRRGAAVFLSILLVIASYGFANPLPEWTISKSSPSGDPFQIEALMPAGLFARISMAKDRAIESTRRLFPYLIFFHAGEIARKHGVRLIWLSASRIQLNALDEVLSRVSPEAKRTLPPIVIWPGLVLPYTGVMSTALPDVGRSSSIMVPTLFSPQGFASLLSHSIAQQVISRSGLQFSLGERLDLEAYLTAQFSEDTPLRGPLDEEFGAVAARWLAPRAARAPTALFDPIYERPWAFRWGGVTLYSLSVMALGGFVGPLLAGLLFILPLAAVSLFEFWARVGLQTSFEKIQTTAPAHRFRRGLYRIPFAATRVLVLVLLLFGGVQIAENPNPAQVFEPFKKTIGQIKKTLEAIQSDMDHVISPTYNVTQLVKSPSGTAGGNPTVGEIASNNPRDWTEIYTFYFDGTIDEKTREYSNPMTGASDPFEAINGLSTAKQVIIRASDLVGFRGVTWQLDDAQDPSLMLGYKVEMKFPNGRVFSWRTSHSARGIRDTYFMAAPDQVNLQRLLRASGTSEIRITMTAYSGATAGNPSLPLKKESFQTKPPVERVSWRLARFQLQAIVFEALSPRRIQERTPATSSQPPASTGPTKKQNIQVSASA